MPAPRFVATPVAGGLLWRLLSGNNRELGRSPLPLVGAEACWRSVARLQALAPGATGTLVIGREGRWSWQLSAEGEPLAQSARGYARQREAQYNLDQFLSAAAQAVPTDAAALSMSIIGDRGGYASTRTVGAR